MVPAFVSGWNRKAVKVRVAFGMPDQSTLIPPANALERRYALHAVKQRLHQASFREAVITAGHGHSLRQHGPRAHEGLLPERDTHALRGVIVAVLPNQQVTRLRRVVSFNQISNLAESPYGTPAIEGQTVGFGSTVWPLDVFVMTSLLRPPRGLRSGEVV